MYVFFFPKLPFILSKKYYPCITGLALTWVVSHPFVGNFLSGRKEEAFEQLIQLRFKAFAPPT